MRSRRGSAGKSEPMQTHALGAPISREAVTPDIREIGFVQWPEASFPIAESGSAIRG